MTIVIGIDPGLRGALAVRRLDPPALHVYDMPTREKRNGKSELHRERLAELLRRYCNNHFTADGKSVRHRVIAVVELVGGGAYTDRFGQRRGQGSAASFAFGKSTGVVLGMLAALQIPVYEVPPGVWKSLMGVTSDKNTSRAMASKLFPLSEEKFKRKKDDGRAESVLLTEYGVQHFLGIYPKEKAL